MSEPTARGLLDEINGSNDGPWVSASLVLASRVEKVLARHHPAPKGTTCWECSFSWPCPTVRILNGGE